MQVKHENASILKRIAPTGYFIRLSRIDAICKSKDMCEQNWYPIEEQCYVIQFYQVDHFCLYIIRH